MKNLNLEQVKKQIVYKQQKIKSLFNQIDLLLKRESQLIAEENNCKQFIPSRSEFNREHRCINCGQFEPAHKGNEPTLPANWENTIEAHLAEKSQSEKEPYIDAWTREVKIN